MTVMNATASEPLLPQEGPTESGQLIGEVGSTAGVGLEAKEYGQGAGVNLRFAASLWCLIKFLKPHMALVLSPLAVADVLLGAQVGKVTGNYYRVLLDKEWDAFWKITALSAIIFAASTAVKSTQKFVSELLAVRWRSKLTGSLQRTYLQNLTFYAISSACDNPDQRMVQDASHFCDRLGHLANKIAATPFKVVYYSIWVWSFASWLPLLVVLLFFLVGACTERLIMSRVASIVCQQEALEGHLRFAHMRIRTNKEQIAMWGGSCREDDFLSHRLDHAVDNQVRLVYWHWALSACTTAFDYIGAILTYCCVALPLVLGMISSSGDSGQMAQKISNASFATLSLIYSLTEVLNLSDLLATLAGLTTRVHKLMQCMEERQQIRSTACKSGPDNHSLFTTPAGIAEIHVSSLPRELERLTRRCFTDVTHQTGLHVISIVQSLAQNAQLSEPSMDAFLQVFVHFQRSVRNCCLDAGWWYDAADPRTGYALYGHQADRWNEVQAAHALLGYGIEGEESSCPVARHPSFGTGVYLGSLLSNAPPQFLWRAVNKAKMELLDMHTPGSGFPQERIPEVRSSASPTTPRREPTGYPASHGRGTGRQIWSNQGSPGAEGCMGLANWGSHTAAESGGAPHKSLDSKTLLVIEQLSVVNGNGGIIVSGLDVQLQLSDSLVVEGQSGVGKTTLLRALRGLWPSTASCISMTPEVMFASQLPIVAPGPTLADQLTYPTSTVLSHQALLDALLTVGLHHLLQRVGGDWNMHCQWQEQLSFGDLQRLACARVLLSKPKLAFMDEPFSALGSDAACQLMSAFKKAGIAVVLTAQPGNAALYPTNQVLVLNGDGSWTSA